MNTTFLVYLVLKANAISAFLILTGVAFMAGVGIFGGLLLTCPSSSKCFNTAERGSIKIGFIVSCILALVFFPLGVLCPTTKQAATLLILPHIIDNKDIQDTVKTFPELGKLCSEWVKQLEQNIQNNRDSAKETPENQNNQ